MSHRDQQRQPVILTALIQQKGDSWNEETHKVVMADSQRVLEAVVAEIGVQACIDALDRQGFEGSAYSYLLKPLHEEALRRRARHTASRDSIPGSPRQESAS